MKWQILLFGSYVIYNLKKIQTDLILQSMMDYNKQKKLIIGHILFNLNL